MINVNRRKFLTSASVAGALAVAVPSLLVRGAGAQPPMTLRISEPVTPTNLDPAKQSGGGSEFNFGLMVFDALTGFDENLNVVPGLAKSWEASEDLKTWTFHLRPGVKFHHGRQLEAQDVIATFERLLNPDTGSTARSQISIIDTVTSPDALTVVFNLNVPYSSFPAVLGGRQVKIVPHDAIDQLSTNPVGTGAFKFVEYRPGEILIIERNPEYWQPDLPKLDRIEYVIIPEFASAVAALQSGDIHIVAELPAEFMDIVAASDYATVQEVPTSTWHAFVFGVDSAPFNDVRVRKAFLKLMDRKAFTEIATFGHGTPTLTPIPPSSEFFNSAIAMPPPDIEGAKALLAEAGLSSGMDITLWASADTPASGRLAVAFRDVAKQANINVEIQLVPEDKYFAETEGTVPFAITLFYGQPDPNLQVYPFYHSEGSRNQRLWHYSNPEVDQILDASRETADPAEQKRLYDRLQEILVEEGPGAVIFVANYADGVSNAVKNYKASPLQWIDARPVTIESEF